MSEYPLRPSSCSCRLFHLLAADFCLKVGRLCGGCLLKGKKRCSPNPPSMKCWNEQRSIYGRLSKRLFQVVFSLEPDRESEEVVRWVLFKRGKGTRQVFFLFFSLYCQNKERENGPLVELWRRLVPHFSLNQPSK